MQWRDRTEARMTTLEVVSDEHVAKINDQAGALVSMDTDIGAMQVEFRTQRRMLQALHLTQQEHTASLRELKTGQEELRLGQSRVLAGVQTIIGLLDRGIDGGPEADDSDPVNPS
jgi:hypothetical protein